MSFFSNLEILDTTMHKDFIEYYHHLYADYAHGWKEYDENTLVRYNVEPGLPPLEYKLTPYEPDSYYKDFVEKCYDLHNLFIQDKKIAYPDYYPHIFLTLDELEKIFYAYIQQGLINDKIWRKGLLFLLRIFEQVDCLIQNNELSRDTIVFHYSWDTYN